MFLWDSVFFSSCIDEIRFCRRTYFEFVAHVVASASCRFQRIIESGRSSPLAWPPPFEPLPLTIKHEITRLSEIASGISVFEAAQL